MQDEMQPLEPQEPTIPSPEHDNEGAMAKADLYKLAKYSMKLFQDIQDDTALEAWVQAKITKAADYIASVYHYLEYEMKFSEYGKKIENSEMYSESQKVEMRAKLKEAREKIAALKIAQLAKLDEGFVVKIIDHKVDTIEIKFVKDDNDYIEILKDGYAFRGTELKREEIKGEEMELIE